MTGGINDAGSNVFVPQEYQALLESAASSTGLPYSVVAAQVQDESGFNPQAVSPTDAEGMFQFEPSTYDSVAQQAGVQPGTEFNPDDEEKAYVVYMSQLLQEEGGSIRDALAAYNAGPGNLAGGMGYADSILSAAGEPTNAASGQGSSPVAGSGVGSGGTQTTSVQSVIETLFGIPLIGSAASNAEEQAFSDISNSMWQSFMSVTGVSGFKDLMIRGGLLLMGLIIFYVGLTKFLDVHPIATAAKSAGNAAKSAAQEGIMAAVVA